MNILICDDDREIAAAIAIYLQNEGYATLLAHDGRQALSMIEQNELHLIIMDVMMPEMDGLRATMEIRRERNIPIVMLSAKSEDTDKIMGLNMGADDYVTKPFNPLELIARVKSQLRRYTLLGGRAAASGEGAYAVGGLTLDDGHKAVAVDGEDVHLTPLEYKILYLLIRHPGRVFSIDEIYERVWGEDSMGGASTVTVHIRRIREKIEINPGEPKYIKVVWGLGYKIEKLDGAPSR
ncbi:MAG: response regulator transcription factor [Clostridiales bacterium]|nr:response regulator transcription factor [Clostridiales bacterium]